MIHSMMQWTLEQLDGQEPVTIFAIVANQEQGSASLTRWRPNAGNNGSEWTQRSVISSPLEDFKELSILWEGTGSRFLSDEDPVSHSLRELVGVVDRTQMCVFPLQTPDGPWGILGLGLAPGHELEQDWQDGIQQFADLAALCLQNSAL